MGIFLIVLFIFLYKFILDRLMSFMTCVMMRGVSCTRAGRDEVVPVGRRRPAPHQSHAKRKEPPDSKLNLKSN